MPNGPQKPPIRTDEYVHAGAKRTNNPEAGLHSADKVKVPSRVKYQYDPHLDPQLVWASKIERGEVEVETISLHKHEVVRPQDVISLVQGDPAQLDLFGDPRLPIHKAVEFYKHDQLWMNRLVLGDSLLVMNSLLHKENLGGQVQMVYFDPPYGIAYNSNFQPRTDSREVQDGKDDSLSREPEQIKAYRDTWTLGVHSYLAYLRDRLRLARELLSERGSIFVQISDENVHLVRCVLDEVFGRDCCVVTIPVKKKGNQKSSLIDPVNDYLLWYARSPRDSRNVKFNALFEPRQLDAETLRRFNGVTLPDGREFRLDSVPSPRNAKERIDYRMRPSQLFRDWPGARLFYPGEQLTSGGVRPNQSDPVEFEGKVYKLKPGLCWKTTTRTPDGSPTGMDRLKAAGRLAPGDGHLNYKRYLDDFGYMKLSNWWDDIGGAPDAIYVVQTNTEIIKRCVLMTTDPGDLVLDITCGSGTTAHVAEQWGRRWVTCDTSRVAVSLARHRLMTASFPFYELAYATEGVAGGFKYKEVRHVTLGSIANCEPPLIERLFDQPIEKKHVTRVAGPFSVEAIAALDPAEAMTPAPSIVDAVPSRPADRVQQLFDVLAKDGGLSVPGKGRIEIEALRRVMDVDGIDAEGEITLDKKKLRLAVAFGPYHGPVTANRLEEAIQAATGAYQVLAVAGFSFDPEVSAYLDKHPTLGVQLFRVQIAPDVQIGDLLKVKHAEKLFAVLGQPDFAVKKSGKECVVTLAGVDLYDPNQRIVKAHQLDAVAAWFLDTDYDGRCFRVRQVFLPAEKGKGFEKLAKSLKAIIKEDAWDALKGFTSKPFELGGFKTVAVKVIDVYGHEVVGVRKVKG
jgi:adenine-specific DNA-methyltransferase